MRSESSTLWSSLVRGVSYVYGRVADSPVGRGLSSYRTHNAADTLSRPVSSARIRLAGLLGESHILGGFSGFFSFLARIRVSLYGVTGFSYGFFGILLYLLLRFVVPKEGFNLIYPKEYLWVLGTVLLLSIPLLFSRKRAGQSLLRGRLTGGLLVSLLGIPCDSAAAERLDRRGVSRWLLPAVLLGLAGAAATLYIHPAILPVGFIAVCGIAAILAYPEVGANLSVLSLPFLWVTPLALPVCIALILVTWLSLLIKWMLMRRTWRRGALDAVMGLLCLSLLLGGMTGTGVSAGGVLRGLSCAILLSVYFLITQLFKKRSSLGGSLFGLSLLFILALPAFYGMLVYGQVSDGALRWLAGSVGGDLLVTASTSVTKLFHDLWQPAGVCLLLILIPLLLSRVTLAERLLKKCWLLLCVVLCFQGLFLADAPDALLLGGVLTVAYVVLDRPKTLAVGLICLPLVICGGVLLVHYAGDPLREMTATFVLETEGRAVIFDSLARMLWEHPLGVGLSESAFAEAVAGYLPVNTPIPALYELSLVGQISASLGIPGLLLLLLTVFFFVQKSFTCLRVSGDRRNRAAMLGGMLACVGMLTLCTVSPLTSGLPVGMTLAVLMGLCSAYENVALDESATLAVVEADSSCATDRVYRI